MRDIADRSIRNIEVRHRHPRTPVPEAPRTPRRRRRSGGRLWLALGIIVLAIGLGLLLSTVFSGANIAIVPRTADVTLPSNIQAGLNAPVGTLSYQNLSASQSATTTVPAKGTEQVQKGARGTLTISNTGATQRLIANTRFQAPDGKIYRIHDSVVVPGGSTAAPGSITATAFADSPGPDYNRSGTTSYTIPGFKGDPRYTRITATSGSMSGGFIGTEPSVAASDLQNAQTALEQQLDTAARAALTAAVADGYELIPGSLKVTYGGLSQTPSGSSNADISETATASGALVRINDLAAAVAKQTVQGYAGEAVTFADPSAVSVSATSTTESSLTVLLSGTATLQWVFDPNALKAAVVGKQKSDFESIIKSFEPAVQKADASIRPFWTSTFPSDPNKIDITIQK